MLERYVVYLKPGDLLPTAVVMEADAQATIAALQQRVAQLEQDSKKASTDYEACRNALDKTVGELTTLQADHARVLGVAEMYRKALSLISVKTTPWFEGHHGTVEDILAAYASYVLKEAASLTSEAAREGGSDESAV